MTTAISDALEPNSADRPLAPPPGLVRWYQQFRRVQIVQSLEAIQDLIAVSLCVGLFCVMVLQMRILFSTLLSAPQFHAITADILFILILVELFRLLIIYLQEQRVSIGVSVEIAIVSALREVIVNGVLETDWHQILAIRGGSPAWPTVLQFIDEWISRRPVASSPPIAAGHAAGLPAQWW